MLLRACVANPCMEFVFAHTLLTSDDSPTLCRQVVEYLQDKHLFSTYVETENGIDGMKFLAMKGAREELRDTPVIMLTGRQERE